MEHATDRATTVLVKRQFDCALAWHWKLSSTVNWTLGKCAVAAMVALLGSVSTCLHADESGLGDFFTGGHVDGELRAYNFDRIYEYGQKPDARAFSSALMLNVQSGSFASGFSVGASLVSANALGTQSDTLSKVDVTLMGPHNSLTALSQAYLQYKNDWLLIRGGDQYLDTPWLSTSDSRVLPASYEALFASVTPVTGWSIYGIRSWDWKSRTSDGFYADNLYYPSTYDGDSMYGNNGSLPATAHQANGAWTAGSTYTAGNLKAELWYYDFLHFARMTYVEGTYTFKTDTVLNPFVAMQYAKETGGSDNFLVETQTQLDGVAGNRVSSQIWGADVGTSIFDGHFDVAYNVLSQQAGAVGDGAIISPYTTTYTTDPLFTSSMLRGLVELGPGHAWKARAGYGFFDDRLQLVTAYTKFFTALRGDSHELYFDVIYDFRGDLKGLSLRDRIERSSGGADDLNPGNRPFTYNRVMISYKF